MCSCSCKTQFTVTPSLSDVFFNVAGSIIRVFFWGYTDSSMATMRVGFATVWREVMKRLSLLVAWLGLSRRIREPRLTHRGAVFESSARRLREGTR